MRIRRRNVQHYNHKPYYPTQVFLQHLHGTGSLEGIFKCSLCRLLATAFEEGSPGEARDAGTDIMPGYGVVSTV